MLFTAKEKSIFDAHELYLSGHYDKALMACEQILARNPDSYSAMNIIANIYFITGDVYRGEVNLNKLKDYFLKKNDYDKAVAVLKRLSDMFPAKEKYPLETAELFYKSGHEQMCIRQYMHIAEGHRRDGYFQKAADIYVRLAGLYERNFDLDKFIINKLALLGTKKELAQVIKAKILENSSASREDKDDVILMGADSGCCPELILPHIPDFLAGGADRLHLIEDVLLDYFINNKDDSLLQSIYEAVGSSGIRSLLEKIKEHAPENVPEDMLTEGNEQAKPETAEITLEEEPPAAEEQTFEIPDAAPAVLSAEQTFDIPAAEPDMEEAGIPEIESHINADEEEQEIQHLELDSFIADDGDVSVDASLSGLEKFDQPDDMPEITPPDGLEYFEIKDVSVQAPEPPAERDKNDNDAFDFEDVPDQRSDDIFSAFDISDPCGKSDDIFAAFDDDCGVKPAGHAEDIFAGMTAVEEPDVEQIDMSDITIEKSVKDDMFEGLVEKKPEKKMPEPTVKIEISENELKSAGKGDTDIFDMEV